MNLISRYLFVFLILLTPVAHAAPMGRSFETVSLPIDVVRETIDPSRRVTGAGVAPPQQALAIAGEAVLVAAGGRAVELRSRLAGSGYEVTQIGESGDALHVVLPAGADLIGFISAWARDPDVALLEPNWAVKSDWTPNDPSLADQWGLSAIQAAAAWEIERGDQEVIVAILDSGLDKDHEDLAGQWLPGIDFVNSDDDPEDDNGHGTLVSGVVAARADNGVGVSGLAPNVKILPVKVLGADGFGSYAHVTAAIYWAVDQGADIINFSLGGDAPSQPLQDAINYAHSRGVIVIAAGGNDNSSNPIYPAACVHVIGVASVNSDLSRSWFSNYGGHIDIAAPGMGILTTSRDGGYTYASGTSLSTPFVTGVAALLRSLNPDAAPDSVEAQITASALDLGPVGRDDQFGHGFIDALATLEAESSALAPPSGGITEPIPASAPHSNDFEMYRDPATGQNVKVAEGEVLLRLNGAGASVMSLTERQAFFAQHDLIELSHEPVLGFHRARITPSATSLENQIAALNMDPAVEYAEPNHLREIHATVPNDTEYSGKQDWVAADTNIDLERAWDIETGNQAVIIAIIDLGTDFDHADLRDNKWTNPSPTLSDTHGFDYFSNDPNPKPSFDTENHGTNSAGAAAARGNNSIGVAGVAWQASIMSLRAGEVTLPASAIAQSLVYAADNGAHVVNMSFGSNSLSRTEQASMQYAYSKGCVLVASAGNDAGDTPQFPAAYPEVIGVGATRTKPNIDSPATFTNYNAPNVDVVAPGDDIRTTTNATDSGYATVDGTSFSGPIVAGAAALIVSRHIDQGKTYTPAKIRDVLLNTAKRLPADGTKGASWDGFGRINVFRAVSDVDSIVSSTVYVYSSGNGTNPTSGDTATAYSTIQAAVNALNPDSGMDTIIVYSTADSYWGGFVLPRQTRLISYKQLYGTDTGPGGDSYPRIVSNTADIIAPKDYSRIEGFHLGGAGVVSSFAAIRSDSLVNATIDNVRIEGVKDGIVLRDATGCSVINSTVTNTTQGYGMNFFGVSQRHFIYNNTITGAETGVTFDGLFSNTHEATRFSLIDSNAITGCSRGIDIGTGDRIDITDNTISQTRLYGIYLLAVETAVVRRNIFTPIEKTGIFLSNVDGIIESNVVTGSVACTWALELYGPSNLTVRYNKFSGCQQGVLLQNNTVAMSFTENDVTGNSFGFRVMSGAWGGNETVVVSQNNLDGNTSDDIRVEGADSMYFHRNWHGTTVNDATLMDINKVSGGTVTVVPYRLGEVDTTPNGDSIAPLAPATVTTAGGGDTIVTVSWSAVTASESPQTSLNLAGYKIYRSKTSDTNYWALAGTEGGSSTSFNDSILTSGETYFYRVTAVDNATKPNESFYSDSIVLGTAGSTDTSGANAWYVNDNATTNDSFTQAVGNDANSGLAPASPKLTIAAVIPHLTQGDTIYVDAGTFTQSDTLTINVNGIFLIGVDSSLTIIDFNDTSGANARTIYTAARTNLTFRNFAVIRGRNGIHWSNVDSSTISGVRSDTNGNAGMLLDSGSSGNVITLSWASANAGDGFTLSASSNNNTVTSNYSARNSSEGFFLSESNNNTLTSNTSTTNTSNAIQLFTSTGNSLTSNTFTGSLGTFSAGVALSTNANGNTLTSNTISNHVSDGLSFLNSDGNFIHENIITNNKDGGVWFDSSIKNLLTQNTIDSNAKWAIYFSGTKSAVDTFAKNLILPSPSRPDSGVMNEGTNGFDIRRNWWGVTDSQAIRNKIHGAGAASITYIPFRLGKPDTAPGADTVAPKAPDTVAVTNAGGGKQVTWAGSSGAEESESVTIVGGYRVYRSATEDTTFWALIGSVDSTVRTYTDTTVATSETRYYRVTAFDAKTPLENEAFLSDSIVVGAAGPSDTSGPNIWYVNDTSTVGDSFTTAVGSSTNDGLSPSTPKRFLNDVEPHLTAGDTVYIDKGRFDETDTFTIDTNGVFIIGVDSASTIIRFDTNGAQGQRAVYARNVTSITLRGFQVTNARQGVRFSNVDLSTIEQVRSDTNAGNGFLLEAGSDTNTLRNLAAAANSTFGIALSSSNGNSVTNSSSSSNGRGIDLASSGSTTISGNTTGSNTLYGISLGSSNSNTISNNLSAGNPTAIYLYSSSGNTISGNTRSGDSNGIFIFVSSNNHIANNIDKINLFVSHMNTLAGNTITGSDSNGITLHGSDSNRIENNRITGNVSHGVLLTGSKNNIVAQNTIDSNAGWAIFVATEPVLYGISSSDTFRKNVILGPVYRPESGVFNTSATRVMLERNWWGTTDSVVIDSMIQGSAADSVVHIPFRLGIVDTSVGIDTVAPKAPDTVAVTTDSAGNTITWAASSGSEEPESSTTVGGYRIYRSATQDTSYWALLGSVGAAQLTYADTTVATGETRYYRVTAFDAKTPFENEAFFSDSIPGIRAGFEQTAPLPFTLLSPVAGAETRSLTLTFSWSNALDSSAVSYRLIVDTDLVGNALIDSTTTSTSVSATLPIADTYMWRVTATDTWGNARNAGDSTFLIDTTPPVAAMRISPISGADTNSATVAFSWTAASDTHSGLAGQRLQVDTTNAFTNLVFDSAVGAASSGSLTFATSETFYWRILATDEAGNTSVSTSDSFRVDTFPPTVAVLTNPGVAAETRAVSIQFMWAGSMDTLGFNRHQLQIDTAGTFTGNRVVDSSTGLQTESTIVLLANDTYFWRVVSHDNAGNTAATTARTLLIDTVVPVAARLQTPAQGTETRVTSVLLTWLSAVDSMSSGLNRHQLQIDTGGLFSAGSMRIDSSAGLATNTTVTLSAGETYHWRVVAHDDAGNTTATADSIFFIDVTPPAAAVQLTPADGHETNVTTIGLTWTIATETQTGLSREVIQISTSPSFATLVVDSSAGLQANTSFTLSANDTYYWRIISHDEAGNTVATTADSFLIDTKATATLVSPDSGISQESRPTLQWSGVSAETYTVQIAPTTAFATISESNVLTTTSWVPTHGLDSGLYYWRVGARDRLGNSETTAARALRIDTGVSDTIPPAAFTVITPADGSETRLNSVSFSWNLTTDTGLGVLSYTIEADDTNTFVTLVAQNTVNAATSSGALTLIGSETYYWRVVAKDAAGNTTPTTARKIFVDTTPPTAATLVGPAAGAETRTTSVTFTWTSASEAQTGFAGHRLQVDTANAFVSLVADSSTGTNTTGTLTLTGTETYYWRVLASDDAGNTSVTAARAILIDTTPPVAAAQVLPSNGAETRQATVGFSWTTATEAHSGLLGHRLQVDSTGLFTALLFDSATGLGASGGITFGSSDTYYWRVLALDEAGNTAVTASRTVRVDLDAPAAPALSAPSPNAAFGATMVGFSWSSAAGAASYRIQVDTANAFMSAVADSSTSNNTSGSLTLAANDTYYWRVIAADAVGNTTASVSRLFFVDTAAPTVPAAVSPKNGASTTVTSIVFVITAGTDNLTGVRRYRFQASTDSTFASVATDQLTGGAATTFTPLFLFTETNVTYFWRVASVDSAGNQSVFTSAESFVKPAPTDVTPPVPVANLMAISDDALSIRLTWTKSTSSDMAGGGQYNVYWNMGDGKSPDTLLKIVAHTGAETYAYNTSGDTTLVGGVTYKFKVRAQDKNGNLETNEAVVAATARLGAANMSHACILAPRAGQRVLKSGGIQIVADLLGSFRNTAETITFQFRRANGGAWTLMTPSQNAASVNPRRILADTRIVYGLHWSADSDNTQDTSYELRALITDQFGNVSDSLSCITAVDITSNVNNADLVSKTGSDTAEVRERAYRSRENAINISLPDDSAALAAGITDLTAKCEFPASTLTGVDDTTGALVTVEARDPRGNQADALQQTIRASLVSSETFVGIAIRVTLPGGQTTLDTDAIITLSYPRVTETGIVLGTNVTPESLQVRHVLTAGGTVTLTPFLVDTVNRQIRVRTKNFSTFIIVAPAQGAPGAQASLTSLQVAPNPFRPNDGNAATGRNFDGALGSGIYFNNLPSNVRIEIYNILGEKVTEKNVEGTNGLVQWDVKNDSNRDVASGFYFYVVTDVNTGQKVTGKLAVIR